MMCSRCSRRFYCLLFENIFHTDDINVPASLFHGILAYDRLFNIALFSIPEHDLVSLSPTQQHPPPESPELPPLPPSPPFFPARDPSFTPLPSLEGSVTPSVMFS